MKRSPRERLFYYSDGAKRDLDGHIWVALIVLALLLAFAAFKMWGVVLAIVVVTIGGVLLTVLTRIKPVDPRSYERLPADRREAAELNDELVQYMSTNGRGCLWAIAIVFAVIVGLMLIYLIGNQSL